MKCTRNPVQILLHLVHRYFIWLILASYIVAAVIPTFGLWIRGVELGKLSVFGDKLEVSLPPLMLALLLFNAGLGVRARELKQLAQAPMIMIGGLFGNLVTPLVFIISISFAMSFWHNPEEAQQILVGLALVASMPIAGASTAWSQNANGNLALSLGLVLITTILSPLLTPLVLHTVGFVTTGDYSEDLHELASTGVFRFLGLWVVFPSLLGILTPRFVGEHRVLLIQPYVKLINYSVLLLLNYVNASLTLPKMVSQPDIDFLAIMVVIVSALCIAAFSSGYLLARFFHADRKGVVALMFGLGMNNNGTGLVLASMALADHPEVMLPIICYNLIQHLVASSVDFALFRRSIA